MNIIRMEQILKCRELQFGRRFGGNKRKTYKSLFGSSRSRHRLLKRIKKGE